MTKRKSILEISLIFVFLWLKGFIVNRLTLPWDENLMIVLSYAIDVILILFYVVKIDKVPLSRIGIRSISLVDILGGFGLGLVLYLVQVLPPVIFMHMDISQFVEPLQLVPLLIRFVFLMVTVGLGEELVFRGFLLYKLEGIVSEKVVAVFFNCLLFYGIHLLTQEFVFDWTRVYSTFATTIVLCVYWYSSKNKSIFPLVIAHALLDLLLGAPGFYLLNLFWK